MKLYKGDDWSIPFSYRKNDDVFDISDISEIRSCFKSDDGNGVEVLLTAGEITIDSAAGGNGTINVPKAKTTGVKKGTQDLMITRVDNTGKEFTHVIEEFFTIAERPC